MYVAFNYLTTHVWYIYIYDRNYSSVLHIIYHKYTTCGNIHMDYFIMQIVYECKISEIIQSRDFSGGSGCMDVILCRENNLCLFLLNM